MIKTHCFSRKAEQCVFSFSLITSVAPIFSLFQFQQELIQRHGFDGHSVLDNCFFFLIGHDDKPRGLVAVLRQLFQAADFTLTGSAAATIFPICTDSFLSRNRPKIPLSEK